MQASIRLLSADKIAKLAALLVFFLATPLQAQGNPQAEQLFQAGKASLARGDVARACSEFAESLRLEAAIGTLLNLANCEEQAGHPLRALALFQSARARFSAGDFRIPFTDQRIAELGQRVPQLIVTLNGRIPPGLQILSDGAQVEANTAMHVEAGKHVVIVKVPRHADQRFEITLAPGERRIIDVELPEQKDPHRMRRMAASVTGAAGAIGVAVGIITGIFTIRAANEYKDHCKAGRCDATGMDAADEGSSYEIISPIAFALGAAGIGTSVYLFLTTPPKTEGGPAAPAPRAAVNGVGVGGVF